MTPLRFMLQVTIVFHPIIRTYSVAASNEHEIQQWSVIWNNMLTADEHNYSLRSVCPWTINPTRFVSTVSNSEKASCIDWNNSTYSEPSYIPNSYCVPVLAPYCPNRPRENASYMCVKRIGTVVSLRSFTRVDDDKTPSQKAQSGSSQTLPATGIETRNILPVLLGRLKEGQMPTRSSLTFDDGDIGLLHPSEAPSSETRVTDTTSISSQSQEELSESIEQSGDAYKLDDRLINYAKQDGSSTHKPPKLSDILKGRTPTAISFEHQLNTQAESNAVGDDDSMQST